MRTTLTLDDDVAAKLQSEARRSGKSFKETVNHALRRGLAPRKDGPLTPYKVKAWPMGARADLDFDNIEELLDQIEGPARR